MKKNLVSVIIPAYNAEKYLAEAVESIISQSYSDIEIIIIDDCSKDNTFDIAKGFEQKDKRVRLFKNEKNMGIGKNRSIGIELAKGEYICWQDADDMSLPDRILHQVEYLKGHKNVGIVGGYLQFFDESGRGQVRKYEEDDSSLRSKIFKYNPVAQPASTVLAEVYKTVGLYNSELRVSEDLEMLFRIGTRYKFANIQEIVLNYRQSNTSLTRDNLKKMEKATLALRKKYKNNANYAFSLSDGIYNFLQRASMFMPAKLRMFVFGIIRGDK